MHSPPQHRCYYYPNGGRTTIWTRPPGPGGWFEFRPLLKELENEGAADAEAAGGEISLKYATMWNSGNPQMKIDPQITPQHLDDATTRFFGIAQRKILDLDRAWDVSRGTPVFTAAGKYTTRGWTEWTQGFQYGCALLAFDATDDRELLELGRQNTLRHMAPHVSHIGVHDHGFNNISTYGNLRRLMLEGRIPRNEWEMAFYEMALKASGAVQAARWTAIPADSKDHPDTFDTGYIHSFNGPHSLFSDTIRSVRSLMVAWTLGHALVGENDRKIKPLEPGPCSMAADHRALQRLLRRRPRHL